MWAFLLRERLLIRSIPGGITRLSAAQESFSAWAGNLSSEPIGVALVLRYAPSAFLNLPRSNPLLWGLVMVLYPLLSVYPQGIIYRAFLFDRYRSLYGSGWGMV